MASAISAKSSSEQEIILGICAADGNDNP